MIPKIINEVVPVASPAYHRAQARLGLALHIDALTLVNILHLLALCRFAVRLAHHRCPLPPLLAGPGGAPRTYSEESLLLIALLRTLLAAFVSRDARLVVCLACSDSGKPPARAPGTFKLQTRGVCWSHRTKYSSFVEMVASD